MRQTKEIKMLKTKIVIHRLILALIYTIPFTGVTYSHELESDKDKAVVNKYGIPYSNCVREASKDADRHLAERWCECVFEQVGLHDYEDRPRQGISFLMSKHTEHAIEVCKARYNRGEL